MDWGFALILLSTSFRDWENQLLFCKFTIWSWLNFSYLRKPKTCLVRKNAWVGLKVLQHNLSFCPALPLIKIILFSCCMRNTQCIHAVHRLVGRVFVNGLGDMGSIPGHVIPKTSKTVLDTSSLNTQQYKVCIKDKVEQFRERSSALPYTSV